MPRPRAERDVQPVAEVVAAALVGRAVGRVVEPPGPSPQVVPRQRDVPGRGDVAEVDDHEPPARRRASPRRRGSARCRCPTSRCALRAASHRCGRGGRRGRRAAGRRRPCRSPSTGSSGRRARKTGSWTRRPSSWPSWTSRAPVWLSVATAAARAFGAGEGRGRARLVVVLDEADEPPLVVDVGREVPAHLPRRRRGRGGRRGACRSSSRIPAAGAPTRGPSTPRPGRRTRGSALLTARITVGQ